MPSNEPLEALAATGILKRELPVSDEMQAV